MDFEPNKNRQVRLHLREGRKRGKKRLTLFILLIAGLLAPVSFFLLSTGPMPPSPSVQGDLRLFRTEEPRPEVSKNQVIEGRVEKRSTLSKSLEEKGISSEWVELIVSKLEPYVNFRKIRGASYRFVADERNELVEFIYESGPTEVYKVERGPQGYLARKEEVPLETHLVKVCGEIRSSLFEAIDAIGEEDQLVISCAEILASEIDFYKEVKEGDRFKVVVEKVYKGDTFVRYGPVRAVEYQRGERTIRGIEYRGSYYDERGVSLRKAFLRAPLRFNRISSTFSRSRRHPILGGVRPHFGVDYAAPPGTPVWAVADGTVVSCGWNSGYGKQVILRHGNGYRSYYGHLSGYGAGIRKGIRVKQAKVIGYVGSTGLSTGPHLDYRLVKEGRFRNPLKERFPEGPPLGKKEMESFSEDKKEILKWIEGDSPRKLLSLRLEERKQ